jgi:hypothetical protein
MSIADATGGSTPSTRGDVRPAALAGHAGSTSARRLERSRLLLQAYLVGLPLWWMLGVDFAMPLLLALALLLASPEPHRRFTLSDHLLAGIIAVLGAAAYVNGFLLSQATMRFLASIYNLSIWFCGLVLLQQARYLIGDDTSRRALLRTAFWSFLLMTLFVWGSFAAAYAVHHFALQAPSLFGLFFGHAIPEGAPLIKQSTTLVFTRPDWGLPGVPMPRVVVYGPYPTATAAAAAVLGTFALLHLYTYDRISTLRVVALEGLIFCTLAATLTRSILAGWVLGAIVGNLIFGSPWRRILACGALAAALLGAAAANLSGAVQYREYSSESRFANYVHALDQTLLSHPVLGLGVKPREEGNHIAVGSHSTFVSSFTKGGALALSLVVAYLVLIPGLRWLNAAASLAVRPARRRAELRVLFTLQVALWVWICFEDIDAPASAAMLIFMAFAFMGNALLPSRQAA